MIGAGLACGFALACLVALLTGAPATSAADPWSAAVAARLPPLFNTTTALMLGVVVMTVAFATLPFRIRFARH
ncbi:MAG TPA: hypothetical protein VEZ11_18640 [Thermoanaerobaculia bacterium]|nr:hypothetical protein [Thermoanaerobaculia bacterium]